MVLTFLIAFFSLIGLLILHELGHFLLAKKFGVRVEEFGVGLPPRLFGKKIGETIYSINLLPFGAFVRLPGEMEETDDPRSFSQQSIGKRALIILGGVVSFWLMAAIFFSVVSFLGAPSIIEDDSVGNLIDPKVQIAGVVSDSPAETAGLKAGDAVKEFKVQDLKFKIQKVREIQELTEKYKGQEITLIIERGEEVFETSLIPRESPPSGEGPMGIALIRTAIKKYPWYLSPWQGILTAGNLTIGVIQGYARAIGNVIGGVPSEVQVVGPVGVFQMLSQAQTLGVNYFINFLGLIAIYLAVVNILPIPAFDGGKLLFLGIEAIRKKPVPIKIEQKITTVFFVVLLGLMVWVTINDISKLF